MFKGWLIGLSVLALVGCGSEQAAVNSTPSGVLRGTDSIPDLRAQQVQLLVEHQRRVTQSLQNLSGRPSTPEVQAIVQGLQRIQGLLAAESALLPGYAALLDSQPAPSNFEQQLQRLNALLASLEQQLRDAQATFDEQERQFGTRITQLTAALRDPNLDKGSRDDLEAALAEVDQAEQDYRGLAVNRIQVIKQQISDTQQDIQDLLAAQP